MATVRPSGPTVRASLLAGFDAFLAERNISLPPLLAAVGLKASDLDDPEGLLSLNAVASLLENAAKKSGDGCLGLRFAESIPPGASGLLGHLLMSAPTVRDAIEGIERYTGLVMSPVSVSFEQKGARGILEWKYPSTFSAPRLQYSGFALGAFVMRLQKNVGEDLRPLAVEFEHRPFECPEVVRRIFGSRVRFDRPHNRMVFDVKTLNRHTPGAAPGLYELISQLGDRMLEEQRQAADIVEQTRRLITARFRSGGTDLDSIATAFGISPRALQGRLKRAGTTFEAEVNAARKLMAESYLRDTGLSMTEIAMLLGFSELSAFTRAVQRWFGLSPKAYRAKARRQ
jgi:AraC-like DNA-binding protein